MTRRSRALSAVLVLASMSTPLGVVEADARTEARRHFRRGMELVVEGNIDGGVAELEIAYEILPHPNVLYNIGRAYAESGRYDESLEYFERYLASDPPDREEVSQILAAVQQRISQRQQAQAQVETGTTTTTTAETEIEAPGIQATADQIQAIRDAATQIATLGEVSNSETLRQRAERMMALAADLERQLAGQPRTGPQERDPATGEILPPDPDTGAGEAIGIAAGNQEGTYDERVESAARNVSSPLDAPASTHIITRQDIELTGLTQIGELLRRVAGVQVMSVQPTDTEVGIRGFNRLMSPRTLVLINGRSLYLDPIGATLWGQFPVQVTDIERIEVIRGPASTLYGANGFSGVVNIITRQPGEHPGTELTAGIGNDAQVRGSISTSGTSGPIAYRLWGGYQQYDRWTIPFSRDREDLDYPVGSPGTGARMLNAGMALTADVADDAEVFAEGGVNYANRFNFFATGGFNDLYLSGPFAYAMGGIRGSWGRVRTFWNHVDFDTAEANQNSAPQQFTWNTYDVEAEFARQFSTGPIAHDFHLGFNYRHKTIDWSIIDRFRRENHYAGFFEDTLVFSENARLVLGLRVDKHPRLSNPVFSPRAAFVVRPAEDQSIRVSYSSAFRTPALFETYVQFTTPTPISAVGALGLGSVLSDRALGTPALQEESIKSAEIGYQNQQSDFFALDVSVYYNNVQNLIGLSDQSSFFTLADYANPNLTDLAQFNRDANSFAVGASRLVNEDGTYHVVGGELGARVFPVDGLDLYANYSLNLAYVNGSDDDGRDERTPSHQFNAGVQYRASFGLRLSADFHYSASTVWPELSITTSGIERVALPLNGYHLVNARIGYKLPIEREVEIGIVGYDLTAQHNRQHPFGQQLQTRVLGTISAQF